MKNDGMAILVIVAVLFICGVILYGFDFRHATVRDLKPDSERLQRIEEKLDQLLKRKE